MVPWSVGRMVSRRYVGVSIDRFQFTFTFEKYNILLSFLFLAVIVGQNQLLRNAV